MRDCPWTVVVACVWTVLCCFLGFLMTPGPEPVKRSPEEAEAYMEGYRDGRLEERASWERVLYKFNVSPNVLDALSGHAPE